MCTAISFNSNNHYFGRNLDLEYRYDEQVVITPRNYILRYKSGEIERKHFAFIGTATIINDYPLYYDATNEHGLSIAGLNFVGNAFLHEKHQTGKINLAPYELIPYILGKCKTVAESKDYLNQIELVDIRFINHIPNAELHWMIADKKETLTLEFVKDGLKIYDNPVGILTNNPPFDFHMMNLNNYMCISTDEPHNNFSDKVNMNIYSKGMGGIGLPGDFASVSRFIRAAFVKLNSVVPQNENDCVGQIFHILSSVEQPEGSVRIGNKFEKTQYVSCCNTDKGIYYYRTYNNHQITAISMFNEELNYEHLVSYKMIFEEQIKYVN